MLEVPETSGRGGGRSRVVAPSRANGTAPGRERVSGSYRANVAPNRAARQAGPQVQTTGEISIVSPDVSMKDHEISLNQHCPCTQSQCPIRGNCVLCIQNHLDHERHIPECIQGQLRPAIESLAKQVELNTDEARPGSKFWEEYDSAAFLKRSIEKHK